ncbi:MAG: tetratricopeptide repeat protein [Xanthobacteraceae bacterium]
MKELRTILVIMLLGAGSPAFAVDTITSSDPLDLIAVRAKIKARHYQGAVADLNGMIDRGVQHADVYNLLGFSLRKSGDIAKARTFYTKALEFDPNHKGALEYSGELYVQVGELGRARQNEAKLKVLCPQGCEELEDLQQAISQADTKTQ